MNDELKSMMNHLEKLTHNKHFFLNDDKSYRVCTLMEWANQFEIEDRHVAEDEINDCRVSTVWLGLNHNYDVGPPLVFETMVFNEIGDDIYCNRSSTWDEAKLQHEMAVCWVKGGCKEDNDL